ncbi:PCMD domain-containing protein [Reichenbachiella ulvae]|uniref:PCMD domain-containing protein n=1 Tax=Reichenbachiella ulvae TaxID=2980104 RepID=A0ABT3CRH9_9BACT|nr:PCMD domain-containing protein [Reichenbachiella ulvae]MCV9386277.1 PCMD domain-containing protein [Reichenbachiella ulvae]
MRKKLAISIQIILMLSSCVTEDYFGKSPYGNIKSISVSNQASNSIISTEDLTVSVEIPAGVDLTHIAIQSLEISTYATADKAVGDILDLNTPGEITIIAENGEEFVWQVNAYVASATPQLNNWDLNLWYKTPSDYYEPGESASTTIWGTGNPGTQILNKLATIPHDLGDGNLAAHLETLDNGKLAGTFGAPISAGSLYTGVFNPDKLDPSDPQAAIEFGTPFTGRPGQIRFKYSYIAGEENKDKNGNALEYPDACDIYAILELRLGGSTERLATAWFRSTEDQAELSSQTVDFVYGALGDEYPDYMKPTDHGYVSADSATFVLPTHITFVASSSFDGANFAGAIGSTLIIDDVEMVYEE